MRRIFVIALVFSFLLSCNTGHEETSAQGEEKANAHFDAEKWSLKKGQDYPYREQMYLDIAYNDTVRSLSKAVLQHPLFSPMRSSNSNFQ